MKKCLILFVVIFLLFIFTHVFANSYLDECTQLLTDYPWKLKDWEMIQKGNDYDPNYKNLQWIQLPDDRITFTGDESGQLFMVVINYEPPYFTEKYTNRSIPNDKYLPGEPYVAQVSFNSAKNKMMLYVRAHDLTAFFIYTREIEIPATPTPTPTEEYYDED